MPNTYTPPVITVDNVLGQWTLFATSYGRTAIAGPRIFRHEPWPEVEFRHATRETAEQHAITLREYLSDCASGKRNDKAPVGKGWWE